MANVSKKLEVVCINPSKVKTKKAPEKTTAEERPKGLDSVTALARAWGLKAS